ncbi:MAG: tetrahydrofolate dehydrogenase/cyclohydrolase catalytic domain-containing protein [Candidatus Nanopelagicus sp.]|jgi:methylenetetrahydrofolate dehydrogenase (NADP+)/methenyltetrahydrofolate cyclohydrolase
MSAIIINGKKSALAVKNQIASEIKRTNKVLGLGTILVGDDPGSVAYVEGKHRDCAEVGINSIKVNLSATASQSEIVNAVIELNKNSKCTGFIVQLPLPKSVDVQKVLAQIDPKKDADGLHPTNLGNLVLAKNSVIPCTPKAILSLLNEYKINLVGAKVLIIGRGTTVGRPLSILLSQKESNATVTLAHTGTKNLSELLLDSDIVIAAIGSPHFLKPEMIKSGVVVIDVGITRTAHGLVGDVDPKVSDKAAVFSPMPGGVGPMTRAMLLSNLMELSNQ